MTTFRTTAFMRHGAIAAALALAGLSAQAQGHPGGFGGGGGGLFGGGHIEHVLDVVDATDAQRAQITRILDTAKADLATQRAAGKALRDQALSLFTATNIDAVSIEALRQQMSINHEAVSKRMSQAMIDVARVLTPEQRAKFAERVRKMQARAAKRQGS